MKKSIQSLLKFFAKKIIKKYDPDVIGITGSIGKTSTKEAVFTVLSSKFEARQSKKNYNNELGLPLTVIGAESAGRSLFGWVGVLLKAIKLIVKKDKNYPKILVLEMGADKPGDISYLLKIVTPKIGIITHIGQSHIEFFKSVEGIKKEKGALVKNLKKDGWAIFNFDDPNSKSLINESRANVLTFGFNEGSDVWAPIIEDRIGIKEGISFKMKYEGSFVPVTLQNVIGHPIVYAALAGAAVGVIYKMNLIDISGALKNLKPPLGRMNIIKGVKNTTIIDDTYNSSPQAAIKALEAISEIEISKSARKFAVFGDMLELGKFTEEGHRNVGIKAAELGIDYIITVGEKSRDIARGAKEAGMPEDRIYNFPEKKEAGIFLQEKIKRGDLILIKGSQGVRMEKVVEEIMAEPQKAESLLVRQNEEWKRKL